MFLVLTVSGSLRTGSINTSVLEAVRVLAPNDIEVVPYEGMATLPHFNPDLETSALPLAVADLRFQVARADALLISSPEYAHGLPGSLKNLLDWLVGSESFAGKPVALMNTSQRATHAHAQLVEVLTTPWRHVCCRKLASRFSHPLRPWTRKASSLTSDARRPSGLPCKRWLIRFAPIRGRAGTD